MLQLRQGEDLALNELMAPVAACFRATVKDLLRVWKARVAAGLFAINHDSLDGIIAQQARLQPQCRRPTLNGGWHLRRGDEVGRI